LSCGLAAGWQVPPIRGGSHRSSCTASSCLRHPAVRAAEPDEAHAAADGGGNGGGEEEVRQQGIGIINRIRRRRKTLAEKSAAKGVVEGVAKDVASLGLLEGVAKDVDMAIAQRRRRLNVKLGTSLKTFKQELLDEVSLQVAATKERRQLVAERREAASRDIASSFDALRSDLNDEIEEALAGVQRGGRTLERALRQMRDTWEAELAELVKEAEAELDLAADFSWFSDHYALRSAALRLLGRGPPHRECGARAGLLVVASDVGPRINGPHVEPPPRVCPRHEDVPGD